MSQMFDRVMRRQRCFYGMMFEEGIISFGLGGPDLGLELVAPNKSLHYWPF